MTQTKKDRIVAAIISLALLGGAFYGGMYFGERRIPPQAIAPDVINKEAGMPDAVDFSLFWQVWSILNDKYIAAASTTDQERVWGAIQGLAQSFGDPYTVFLPPEDAQVFEETITGNFGGVGMEIGLKNGLLTVIAPLPNTPASRAGIKTGDSIIQIDDTSTAEISIERAVSIIRGEVGTPVILTLLRDGRDEAFKVTLVREVITIPTIETELRGDGVFVIRLFNFSAIAPMQFREALRAFIEAGTDTLVIDLRGNPGGYLEAAIDTVSWFLPAGKLIVQEELGAEQSPRFHRSKGYDIFNEHLKLAVLVNEGSASASEIFAGAIQDHRIGVVVGATTFGKGSVQELVDIGDDASLKVTVAQWLTPNGRSISKGGLAPDIESIQTAEDAEAGRDTQLERAAETLRQMSK